MNNPLTDTMLDGIKKSTAIQFVLQDKKNKKDDQAILITDNINLKKIKKSFPSPCISNFVFDLRSLKNDNNFKTECKLLSQRIENSFTDGLNTAIIAVDGVDYEQLFCLVESLQKFNLSVKILCKQFNVISDRINKKEFINLPAVEIYPPRSLFLYSIIKRLFDISFSIFVILLLLPFFLAIAAIIKITSSGPVFFKQLRIGKNFRQFYMYKFRSMNCIKGEDEERKKMMIQFMKEKNSVNCGKKIINTRRVTWIGKFLRKTSLDEFPQLINVIKGEMSLIGPRPELPYVFENYEEWQKKRFKVLPGCTGVWQVWGRSSVSFNESILMDLYYVNNISPMLDLKIFLKTFPVLIFGIGGE